jgi:hypothetical protein
MAYQDIQAAHVVDLPQDAALGEFSAGKLAIAKLSARRSREWVRHVLILLDEAVHQLQSSDEVAQGAIFEATSLLRKQIDSEPPQELPDGAGDYWPGRRARCVTILMVISQGRYRSRISARSLTAARRTSRAPSSVPLGSHPMLS